MNRETSRRGIEIPEEIATAAAIPDDLDANVDNPYAVPDTAQRRKAARVYLVGAALTAAAIAAGLPQGMWLIVGAFLVLAAYQYVTGWRLAIREGTALERANQAIGFPVGHASANLGFTGWRMRPIWNVLVFSGDDPPSRRGLIRIDAIDGSLVETYSEDIPLDER